MMFLGYIFGILKVIFNIFKNELFVYGMFLFRNPKGNLEEISALLCHYKNVLFGFP